MHFSSTLAPRIIIIVVAVFGFTRMNGQAINIPDPIFNSYLLANTAINTNGDSLIQVSEANSFSGAINISYSSVYSLIGIEEFTSLLTLDVSNTQLDTLDLSMNHSLKTLKFRFTRIEELNLNGADSLEYLDCYGSKITSLDVSNNLQLQFLYLNENNLSTLNVSNNSILEQLYVNNNFNLMSIVVNGADSLMELSVTHCNVKNLDVSNNLVLKKLWCNDSLASLDVTNNILLEMLQVTGTFSSLDVTQNAQLKDLAFSGNVSSIDLSQNTLLEKLWCNYNNLSSLNLQNNPLLIWIHCNHNNLDTLDLSNNSLLEVLECTNNNIGALDFSNNPLMLAIDFRWNQISTMTINNKPDLYSIKADLNQMVDFSFNNCPAITVLWLTKNQLTSIDLSGFPDLYNFKAQNNQLTSLDISANPTLRYLYCDSNNFNSVDLRNGNNINLQWSTSFLGNPNLNCVSVDDPAWSATNWNSYFDHQVSFSNNCTCNGIVTVEIDSTKDVTCLDSGLISVSVSGAADPIEYSWNNLPATNDSVLNVGEAGIYVLTVVDSNSCSRVKSVLLNGPKTMGFDMNALINNPFFQPGQVSSINLDAFNEGCVITEGTLKLIYGGPISYLTSDISPDSINGDTLVWLLDSMDYQSLHFLNSVKFFTDTTAMAGQLVCFDVIILPESGDAFIENNRKQYCFDVITSYDPNNKEVFPIGECAPNYVRKDEQLTYTINFQNIGTANAINIFILDTLNSMLDISSLSVISTSHQPLITEISDNSIVKFRFDNINLVDSASNESLSKGFVTYRIVPKAGLGNGTVIDNEAHIYFDYNTPITTNSTFNTLTDIIPTDQFSILDTSIIENGQVNINGQDYADSGVYYQYFQTSMGCDSTLQISISIDSTVIIIDTIAPVITGCPIDFTKEANHENCSAIVTWTTPTVLDNVGMDTIVSNFNSGDLFELGMSTVIYTGTDINGNSTSCSFTVNVTNDLSVATIVTDETSTGNGSIELNVSGGVSPYTFDWDNDGTGDNDDVEDLIGIISGIYSVIVSDSIGCSDTTNAIVNDSVAPNITGCPIDFTKEANHENCSAIVTWTTPTVLDNVGMDTIVSNFNSGDLFELGMSTVIYTGTDINGNSTSCSFTVNVTTDLSVATIVTDETSTGNGSIELNVSGGVSPYTFDWNNDGTGDNDDVEDLIGIISGIYTVIVSDSIGCSDTSNAIVNDLLGIENIRIKDVIEVYPNPNQGEFMLKISEPLNGTMRLYNVAGEVILKKQISAYQSEVKFELETLQIGMYFININTDSESYYSKLFIR